VLVTVGGDHQRIGLENSKIERQSAHHLLLTESLMVVQSVPFFLICC
jgi:hypothetical protein